VHLYLVRHGETDWNAARRIQGSTDIPLNETGRRQAAGTGRLLARRSWDALYASPLSRAFETASIIAGEIGLPAPIPLPEIVERNYGEAEGLTGAEIDARFPGDAPVPGRETREEVVARVLPALLELAERHSGQNVIVVGHGGVIRSVLHAVDPEHDHGPITNGSVHSFAHDDGSFELIAFDDPLEHESLENATGPLDIQNELEHREATGAPTP
jgi:probable phosphoglycerate mutase